MTTSILLLEDEHALLQMLAAALRDRGFSVVQGTTWAEGLEAARAHRPDAVVTDWGLAAGDGIVLLRNLLSEGYRGPAVLTSGGCPELPPDLVAAGVVFLRKPFAVDDLVGALGFGGSAMSEARS